MQGVFGPGEALESDEPQRVLLATPGLLTRNQDVHLRELTVPHPVHERDFRSVVIEVAEGIGTVEEDAQRRVLRRPASVGRVLCDGRQQQPRGGGHGRRLKSWYRISTNSAGVMRPLPHTASKSAVGFAAFT